MLRSITANGATRFLFTGGPHSLVVALGFTSPADAAAALVVLGAPWKVSERDPRSVVALLTSEQADAFEASFAPKGHRCSSFDCKRRPKVHGWRDVAHSIDYGPPFEVTLSVEVAEQGTLPGVTL